MKVLIVDDEKPARDRLRQMLGDLDGYIVIGEAATGEGAIAESVRHEPDVVLLDIRMPGLNGIETAHHLNAMENPPAIVFTTAYDEYAIDAFDAQAIGYVLKPVRSQRLQRALEQAARLARATLSDLAADSNMDVQRKHVCARAHGELLLIPIDDVHCFIADQKYLSVYHANGTHLIEDSLKSLEQEFQDQFVRIHRSALVAVRSIDRLEKSADGKTRVVLREAAAADPGELTISRRHLASVRRRLRRG